MKQKLFVLFLLIFSIIIFDYNVVFADEIPTITANNEDVFTEDASSWTSSATANDDIDGDITANIDISYFKADGETSLTDLSDARSELYSGLNVVVKYNVQDSSSNPAIEVTITLTSIDNTSPVIIDPANSNINTEDLDSWFPTADASDNKDGNLSNELVISYFEINGTDQLADLDAARLELYEGRNIKIKYNLTDNAGNIADQRVQTVSSTDNTPPVITASDDTITASEGSSWTDSALANDNVNGDITANIDISYFKADGTTSLADLTEARSELSNALNIVVKYNVSDSSSNQAIEVVITITSISSEIPVISASDENVNISDANSWDDSATATDDVDGDISSSITILYYKADGTTSLSDLEAARLDLNSGLNVVIKYNVTDSDNNDATEVIITLTSVDDIIPVINAINENVNTSDASSWITSSTASDNIDGNITSNIVVTYFKADGTTSLSDLEAARLELSNGLNVIVRYNVDDSSGNSAVGVFATITSVDNEIPVISAMNEAVNTDNANSWVSSATASDNIDGDITSSIVIAYFKADGTTSLADLEAARLELENALNVIVKYNVSDSSDNDASEVIITLSSVDNGLPVITASNEGVNSEDASSWLNSATAFDDIDGDITVDLVISYFKADGVTPLADLDEARLELGNDLNVIVKYNVEDSNGNDAIEVIITLTSIDSELPVITASNENVNNTEAFSWVDSVVAFDNVDGDITEDIVITYFKSDGLTLLIDLNAARLDLGNGLNVVVKYNVEDSNNNDAIEVVILLTSIDSSIPVISANNENVNTSDANSWVNSATANDDIDGDISSSIVISYFKADGVTPLADLSEVRLELTNGLNVLIKYNVEDSTGNLANEVSITLTSIDNENPVIFASSENILTEDLSTWEESVTASDNVDGDISLSVNTTYFQTDNGIQISDIQDVKDLLYLGTNVLVKYNVSDSSGNIADEVIIFLTPTDDTPPVISGFNNTVKTENAPFWEPIFTVIDNFDEDITESTIIEYYEIDGVTPIQSLEDVRDKLYAGIDVKVLLQASDAAGNIQVIITVTGVDNTPPVIYSNNKNVLTEDAISWIDNVTVTDNKDGDITDKVSLTYFESDAVTPILNIGEVRTLLFYGYNVFVKYDVSDAAGNENSKTILLNAVDNTPPNINVIPMTVRSSEYNIFEINVPIITDNIDLETTWFAKYYLIDGTTEITESMAKNEIKNERKIKIEYYAYDNNLNQSTHFETVEIIDDTAPIIRVSEGSKIMSYGDVSISDALIGVSETNLEKLEYSVNNNDFIEISVNYLIIIEGRYEIRATDIFGNSSAFNFVIDKNAPSFTVVSSGYEVYNNDFVNNSIRVNASAVSDISLSYSKDGGDFINFLTGTEFTEDGVYLFKAVNSTSVETTFNVVIDTVSPVFDNIPDLVIEAGKSSIDFLSLINNETDNFSIILPKFVISNNVDFDTPGIYSVSVEVTDEAMNETIKTFSVTVRDTTAPIFDNLVDFDVEAGSNEIDLLSLIKNEKDNSDSILTKSIISENIDYDTPGIYEVSLRVIDESMNEAIQLFNISIVDTIAPSFNEISFIQIEASQTVIDIRNYIVNPTDNSDTVLTKVIVADETIYDTPGEYVATLKLVDGSMNETAITFMVIIVDTTSPTFDEILDIELEAGNEEIDFETLIINAKDNSGSKLDYIIISNPVNFTIPGEYLVEVKVVDESLNESVKSFTVNIVDTTPPTFTSPSNQTIQVHDTSTNWDNLIEDLNDNSSTEVSLSISSINVNTHVVGNYTIGIIAMDSSGNLTTDTMVVEVVDNIDPTYEILKEKLTIKEGTDIDISDIIFVIDNYDGDITSNVTIETDQKLSKSGTYDVLLVASDSSGNRIELPYTIEIISTNYLVLIPIWTLGTILVILLFFKIRKPNRL